MILLEKYHVAIAALSDIAGGHSDPKAFAIEAIQKCVDLGDSSDTPPGFVTELQQLINCHSKENGSNTPDFILAKYLDCCLTNFNLAVSEREKWYGRQPIPAPTLI